MKKSILMTFSAVLALAILLSSCGGGAGGGQGDSTTAAGTTTAPVETSVIDTLPSADYGGAKFRILGEQMRDYYFVEELNGEIINDAVFDRNSLVSELYNTVIEFNIVNWQKGSGVITEQTLAGASDYELYATTHLYLGSNVTSGCFTNWLDVPGVNLDKPWYVAAANECYSIGRDTLLLFGDFMESNVRNCYTIVYNKKQAENYGIDGLYELIDSGGWTVDYFLSIIKDIYTDTNGDGVRDQSDFYGFATDVEGAFDSFSRSFGLSAISKDKDNYPVLDFYNEKTVAAYEKLYQLFWDNVGTFPIGSAFGHITTMFTPGTSVFANMMIISIQSDEMRGMEDDYGILPYFKFEESQEKYYTYLDGTFSAQTCPITQPADKLEVIGHVTEALNALSSELVMPAMYDVALKVKIARDEDSVRMLDYVLEGRAYSFDSFDESGFPFSPNRAIRQLLKKKSIDISSYYEANSATAQAWIDKMIDSYNAAK